MVLPKYYWTDKRKAARFIGLLILLTVGYEMYYRVTYEGFGWGQVVPLHFCSVSVMAAGVYLRTQKDQYFQVAYYFSFGAFLAMILPGISDYHHQLYFILFMVTHYFVLFAVVYGFKWLGARPTWEGLKYAARICLLLFGISFSQESYKKEKAGEILEEWFDGSAKELLSAISGNIKKDDTEELKGILDGFDFK